MPTIIAAGVALLVLTAWLQWSAFAGISVDDAFITFRYARNWAEGWGPVYNAGEAVEGYSSFLWLALLALCHVFVDDVDRPAQVIGMVAAAGSVVLAVWSLPRLYGIAGWAPLAFAAGVIATSGYVAAWAVGGLESALYGLLLLGLWVAFVSEHRADGKHAVLSMVLCVAVALARPEGLFVALAFVAAHLFAVRTSGRDWKSWSALSMPVIVLGVVACYHGWRFAYYGPHFMPNSVRAKVGISAAQALRGSGYVTAKFLDPYLPLLAGAWLFPRVRAHWASWLGVALFSGYLLFIVVAGGDWSEGRFFAPLVPLGAVLCTAAVTPRIRAARRPLRIALGIASALFAIYAAGRTGGRELSFRRLYVTNDLERVQLGKWLSAHAPKDIVLAVTQAGQIPYYSRLYTHDMLGLNDSHIAALQPSGFGTGMPGMEKFDVRYTVDRVKPDMVIGAEWIPGMRDYLAQTREYVLLPLPYEEVLVRRGVLPPESANAALRAIWGDRLPAALHTARKPADGAPP